MDKESREILSVSAENLIRKEYSSRKRKSISSVQVISLLIFRTHILTREWLNESFSSEPCALDVIRDVTCSFAC